jgi:rubrerythrin
MDDKQILTAALSAELEAMEFYRSWEPRMEHEGARVLLAELAAEEDRHATLFREALAGRFVPQQAKPARTGRDSGRELRAPVIDSNSEPSDVVVFAIHKERKARDRYLHWAELAEPRLAGLLKAIAEEEEGHLEKLEDLLYNEFFKDN